MTVLFLAQLLVSQNGEANNNGIVGLHFGLGIYFRWGGRQLARAFASHTICKRETTAE